MRRLLSAVIVASVFLSTGARAIQASGGDVLQVQDLVLTVPEDWKLHQDAKDNGKIILGFSKGNVYTTIYLAEATGLDMNAIFVNDSEIEQAMREESFNAYSWKRLDTSKELSSTKYYISSFLLENEGYSYYGYTKATSLTESQTNAALFLDALK